MSLTIRSALPFLALAAVPLLQGVASADHQNAYRAFVTTSPSPPTVGATARVFTRIYTPWGARVFRFDDLHTQNMHMIVVSQDLEDFSHVHPTLSPFGYLSTPVTFGRATPYSVFMEYDPRGAAPQQVSRATIRPVGAQPAPAQLDGTNAFDGSQTRQRTRQGTRTQVIGHAGERLRVGAPARLHLRVRDANGGIVGLTDYLGMPAHAIVLSENLSVFQHLHGERIATTSGGSSGGSLVHGVTGPISPPSSPGSSVHDVHGGATTGPISPPSAPGSSIHDVHGTGGGPVDATTEDLFFDVTFPTAGLYKVFFQFQRNGAVVTVPFVVRVS